MRKIVVASHSLLAQGFKDTLEFLTGKGDAVNAVCAYVNDNGEGLDAAVEALALVKRPAFPVGLSSVGSFAPGTRADAVVLGPDWSVSRVLYRGAWL